MCLAVPGRLLEITGDDPLWRIGRVDFGGIFKDISLACVPEATVGAYVLVHAGVTLSIVDEEEAQLMLDQWRAMAELTGSTEEPP